MIVTYRTIMRRRKAAKCEGYTVEHIGQTSGISDFLVYDIYQDNYKQQILHVKVK